MASAPRTTAQAVTVSKEGKAVLLRRLHLAIGVLGLMAFILSGQYMHWVHGHLRGVPDGPRLFMRSAHIYLMWSSSLNLVLGCYFSWPASRPWRAVQALASLLVLAAPVLLGVSFIFEPYGPSLMRPLGAWATILALVGVLVHVVGVGLSRRAGAARGA